MAMLRHRAAQASTVPVTLLYSSRTFEDIIYREELDALAARKDGLTVIHTLTRSHPPGWTGETRRIDREMLARVGLPPASGAAHFHLRADAAGRERGADRCSRSATTAR